jgi:hypothetical protein
VLLALVVSGPSVIAIVITPVVPALAVESPPVVLSPDVAAAVSMDPVLVSTGPTDVPSTMTRGSHPIETIRIHEGIRRAITAGYHVQTMSEETRHGQIAALARDLAHV